jgi:hypothetical protein
MPGLPRPPEREEEIRAMYALYESGLTMEEVGAVYGIGRERVRQLFVRLGLPRRSGGRRPAGRDASRAVGRAVRGLRERQEVGRDALAAGLGLTVDELADLEAGRRGVTWLDLRAIVGALDVSLSDLADAFEREQAGG